MTLRASRRLSMLRRTIAIWLSVLALLAVTTTAAFGASAHFKHGGEPRCTTSLSGSTASTTCTGSLTGLGNGDVTINTSVSGFAVYTCTNNGGNAAPGQNRVLIGPGTSSTTIPSGEIKNGNLTFTTDPAVLTAPSTVSGSAAGCPNSNWTGTNPQLTVTSITETISQGGQTLFTCSASNPNGLSGSVSLAC